MNQGMNSLFYGSIQYIRIIIEEIPAPPPAINPGSNREIITKMGISEKENFNHRLFWLGIIVEIKYKGKGSTLLVAYFDGPP